MVTNVLGGEIRCCCRDPLTGFYRDGYCRTGAGDVGLHTVCAEMTEEFLEFSRENGNDLITPHPEWDFPGPEARRQVVRLRDALAGSFRGRQSAAR